MSLPVSRDMVLDSSTLGNSPACHIVVQMMNDGIIPIHDKHKVLSIMNDVSNSAKHLSEVSHVGVRSQAVQLSRDYYCSRVDQMPYHEKFKTHLKSVIQYFYKKSLEKVMRVNRTIAR